MIFKNTFPAFLCVLFLISAGAVYADNSDLKPTPVPKIPVNDFDKGSQSIIDGSFVYQKTETDDITVTATGAGFGYNYVNSFDRVGWNAGAGFAYVTGGDSDDTVDVDIIAVPIMLNLAFRPFGTPDSFNAIIFGGIHYTYMGIFIDAYPNEIDLNIRASGPQIGIKASIPMGQFKILPYFLLQRVTFNADVNVNGYTSSISIPSETYKVIGFDIEIGSISIGTMLDLFTNADKNMISLSVSYNMDYNQ